MAYIGFIIDSINIRVAHFLYITFKVSGNRMNFIGFLTTLSHAPIVNICLCYIDMYYKYDVHIHWPLRVIPRFYAARNTPIPAFIDIFSVFFNPIRKAGFISDKTG